ncbi:FabG Dehydrogenases with different specificities (related to short-chain alcohol dehydrogenases) [Burkholderiaceae bacterium]
MSALDLFSLKGRVVLVSGASRGIGLAIAQGLQEAGAQVLGFSRSAAPSNIAFDYQVCDITDGAAFDRLVKRAHADHGHIDGYLHVAGVTNPTTEMAQGDDVFSVTMDVNLSSAYRCCRSVAKVMAAQKSGSIAMVTSIGAFQGFPGNPAYVASKGGLRMLSKALALDWGALNIRVNALAPGYIETDMTKGSFNDPVKREARSARTMLGRWGKASELLGAAIFLMSDASSYMTGADLVVDGGWTAKGL